MKEMKVIEKTEYAIGDFQCPCCKKWFMIYHVDMKTKTKHEVKNAPWLKKPNTRGG